MATVNRYAGNGGAGGIYTNDNYSFSADTYNITVGAGGTASSKKKGANGENSFIGSLVVYGGGAGGLLSGETTNDINGSSGGSGGGAGQYYIRSLNYSRGIAGETIDTNQGSNASSLWGGNKVTESDITGINVKFANSNVSAIQNTGAGGLGAKTVQASTLSESLTQTRNAQSGAKGIVVIRVPKNASITTTGTVTVKQVAELTPSSTKYVFITDNPSIVLSSQSDGSDLPSLGYTAYRKLGSVTIDASGHITAFARSVDNQPWT